MIQEYDEVTCITAGELRAAGYSVPVSVPDCGWVRRRAMRTRVGGTTFDAKRQTITSNIGVEFLEPFQWIAFKMEIPRG